MKKIDDLRYVAEGGYVFVEKETGKRFGSHIYLGAASIKSFKEDKMTDEELEAKKAKEEEESKRQESHKKRR